MRQLAPRALLLLISPLACLIAAAQQPAEVPSFDSVDIRASAPNTMPSMRARFGNGGHYELRNATAVDLIRTAWGADADSISGGPDWLDLNRYDVTATAPATATPQMLRTMLQATLKDRFQLVVRNGEKQRPGYAITVDKKPLLQAADESETSGCNFKPFPSVPRGSPRPPETLVCTNVTLAAFLKLLPATAEASGYVFDYPLVDHSGLTGSWSFNLTWSPRQANFWSPPATDAITLFDAFEKQLGLNLELTKVAIPVLNVENATPPRVTTSPKPRVEFEVAEIRPEDPNGPPIQCHGVNILPGGTVRINMTLRDMIWESWGAPFDFSRIIGGPPGMDSPCWQLVAKIPVEQNIVGTPNVAGWIGPVWHGVDLDTMRMSLRSFLVDRFKLASHMEDRMIDGYVLAASHPKLKKANPANRPSCKEGPGDDGKDPRLTNPLATRLITCRSMTLTQFAAELTKFFPGSPPMTDSTGLAGRYDMTINFSPGGLIQTQNSPAPRPDGDVAPAAPDGAISLFDALKEQLGLKIESRKVLAPVLIVDRVNVEPTAN